MSTCFSLVFACVLPVFARFCLFLRCFWCCFCYATSLQISWILRNLLRFDRFVEFGHVCQSLIDLLKLVRSVRRLTCIFLSYHVHVHVRMHACTCTKLVKLCQHCVDLNRLVNSEEMVKFGK